MCCRVGKRAGSSPGVLFAGGGLEGFAVGMEMGLLCGRNLVMWLFLAMGFREVLDFGLVDGRGCRVAFCRNRGSAVAFVRTT